MSNNIDKFKHSKRLLKEENAIKKQSKILKNTFIVGENKDLKEPHRLAKKHALDCGNPKCTVCGNPRKVNKKITIQEQKLFQDLDEVRDKKSNGLKVEK